MTESDWIALGSIAAVVTAVFTAAMAIAIIVSAIYAKRTLVAAKDEVGRARVRRSSHTSSENRCRMARSCW